METIGRMLRMRNPKNRVGDDLGPYGMPQSPKLEPGKPNSSSISSRGRTKEGRSDSHAHAPASAELCQRLRRLKFLTELGGSL